MGRTHEYKKLVREKHLDSLNHMNNAQYVAFFEEARWEWSESVGFGYKKMIESGISMVILDLHLNFLNEVRLREMVSIESEFTDYRGKTGVINQVMKNAANEVCCEAKFTVGLFDLKNRRLVQATPEIEEKFDLIPKG